MGSRRRDRSITAQKPPQGALTRLYMRRTPHGTSRAKKNHRPARRDSMVRFRFSRDFSLHRSKRWWARRTWPSRPQDMHWYSISPNRAPDAGTQQLEQARQARTASRWIRRGSAAHLVKAMKVPIGCMACGSAVPKRFTVLHAIEPGHGYQLFPDVTVDLHRNRTTVLAHGAPIRVYERPVNSPLTEEPEDQGSPLERHHRRFRRILVEGQR